MGDFEDSDEERYANESFENESDNEVPDNTEIDSDASNKSDENNHIDDDEEGEEGEEENEDDDDDLASVKLNTGPIQRRNFSNIRHENDVIPFASSSDEEDDVVVGKTLVEINTPAMCFGSELSSTTTLTQQFVVRTKEEIHLLKSVEEDQHASSEEVSEEETEEDVEAEFQRIQEMEEKYILQNSAKTPKFVNMDRSEANTNANKEQVRIESEEESESDIEDEEMDEVQLTQIQNNENKIKENLTDETVTENINDESQSEDEIEIPAATSPVEDKQSKIQCNQTSGVESNESSYTNLKLLTEQRSEEDALKTNEMLQLPLLNDNLAKLTDTSIELNIQKITTDFEKDLETTLPHSNVYRDDQKIEKKLSKISIHREDNEATTAGAIAAKEKEIELEREQNNAGGGDDCNDHYDETETYYDDQFDYHITSKTPTSFNSDDYIFHANFIKQCQRTMNSLDRSRPKPQPRKSMSFSNERMREIERHNQILLRKILTQKPTYGLRYKSTQPSLQKKSVQTPSRLTTSAVNRKKQQRQIDIDNQILKKKIEAIAVRRRPLMS